LWRAADFRPSPEQKKAITFIGRPLFIKAGPGSGKTRVLLWRTVHLLVHRRVKPQEIFLSTFTEKAARQLEEGLRGMLALVTERTGEYFDLANMYIGTLHSLCQRITTERRFSPHRQRPRAPLLMDELAQYLYLSRNRNWNTFLSELGWKGANMAISQLFDGFESQSRHRAASSCISLFNRLSEECLDPRKIRQKAHNPTLRKLIDFYSLYREGLEEQQPPLTDFALLQQSALKVLDELDEQDGTGRSGELFKHVIIDEYQDTNTIQERLVFRLSAYHKNICVVGDDDQALYRFRGATVENFVQFPERCLRNLGTRPHVIELGKNYRSRKAIVDFYSDFIEHPCCDWRRTGNRKALYRVLKKITAERRDEAVCVIASNPGAPPAVCNEIATLVKRILKSGKVEDPNQIAFLFPSLKARSVQRMKDALIASGLKVFAPRAGTFLEVDEAREMLGLFVHVFGKPEFGEMRGRDYENFHEWIESAYRTAKSLRTSDPSLNRFVEARQHEIRQVVSDYKSVVKLCERRGWELDMPYDPDSMKKALLDSGVSKRAKRTITSPYVERLVRSRQPRGLRPFSLKYMILRSTSLDWNVLDLLYRFCGFRNFRKIFIRAEEGAAKDEGPICNLSLLSQYLARFLDEFNASVLSADFLSDDKFQRTFFMSYLYALYRRGEAEYEDAEDPFPRGRIPFLTIHQAKGLEFPVVILGNPRKRTDRPQRIEEIVQPLLKRHSEPLDRMPQFDAMRMFYVALSRAKNLLVIAQYKGQGQHMNEPFRSMLDDDFHRTTEFDVDSLPKAENATDDLPKTYSYTGDFLLYKRCPRQYMAFRKYGFAPARSQTMFFGSLVHQTIEDLHQHLIGLRGTHA
jgi:DNA helicase-2/ATP-dependent DNA helicase PcrA